MESRLGLVHIAIILCSCHLALSKLKASDQKASTSNGTTAKPLETTTVQSTTPPTTESKPVKIAIPKFDFAKLTDNPEPEKKSGKSSVPSNTSQSDKSVPTDSCATDMCKIMNGICKNNGRCIPQVCQSDIICDCSDGYTGQFCDTTITEVILANDVPMINGKIVSTEAPRVKNGKTNGNGKSGDPTHAINGKLHVSGHANDTQTKNGSSSDKAKDSTKTTTGTVCKGSSKVETAAVDHGNSGKVVKSDSGCVSNYTQPKGSFRKGPEVPTPTASRPLNINIKKQKIKEKSTTIIQHFTDIVTISTVSIKLEQPLSLDVSGQTMAINKGFDKLPIAHGNNTTKGRPASGDQPSEGSKGTAKQSRNNQKTTKGRNTNGNLHRAKNVEQVVLTNGKLHLVGQSVKPSPAKPVGPKSKKGTSTKLKKGV